MGNIEKPEILQDSAKAVASSMRFIRIVRKYMDVGRFLAK